MTTRKPGLKLVHQILILVSIPLMFQILSVVLLESLWKYTRDYGRQAIVYKDMVLQMKEVDYRTKELVDTLDLGVYDGQVTDLVASRELFKQIKELEKLLVQHNKKDDKEVKEIVFDLHQVQIALSVNDSLIDSRTLRRQLIDTNQKVKKYFQKKKEAFESDKKEAKLTQETIQKWLITALIMNIVLCPCLVLFLSQRFSSRLRSLVSNSEDLKQGKKLAPSIGGHDEIAQLEHVFMDMAESITAAKEKEKQFVTMVSHDLRTPLNSVLATLNLVSEGKYGEVSEKGIERLKSSEESIERLVRLTDDLLDMERLSSGNGSLDLKNHSLKSLIDRAVEEIKGFADFKNIDIKSDDNNIDVLADEDRIVQVLVNFLSNAIKFSDDGESVFINVKDLNDSYVEVKVIDQGRGIPEESVEYIFSPFHQVEEEDRVEHQGSGMGLAISKSIVEEHGGKIGFHANDDKGTTFWFTVLKGRVSPAES